MTTLILQSISQLLFFFINLYALDLLFQGHNNPGGGFIAGLLSALSFVLILLSFGVSGTQKILRVDPLHLAGVGLILAYLTSTAPLLFGQNFLKSSFTHLELPFFGELHIGTPLFFDSGVYLVVVGVTVKLLVCLASSVTGKRDVYFEKERRS